MEYLVCVQCGTRFAERVPDGRCSDREAGAVLQLANPPTEVVARALGAKKPWPSFDVREALMVMSVVASCLVAACDDAHDVEQILRFKDSGDHWLKGVRVAQPEFCVDDGRDCQKANATISDSTGHARVFGRWRDEPGDVPCTISEINAVAQLSGYMRRGITLDEGDIVDACEVTRVFTIPMLRCDEAERLQGFDPYPFVPCSE